MIPFVSLKLLANPASSKSNLQFHSPRGQISTAHAAVAFFVGFTASMVKRSGGLSDRS